jgi:hypothetical protein
MSLHLSPPTVDVSKHTRKPLILAACGAAVVLAVAAGIGARQLTRDEGVSETATTGSGSAQPAAVSAAPRDSVRPASDLLSVVYLAGSPDEADRQQQIIDEGNVVRASFGMPRMHASVLVITSPDQESMIRSGLADADAIGVSLGLPPVTIIDLRPAAGGPGTADGTALLIGGVAERYAIQAERPWVPRRLTVYIAGTPEQADAMQRTIDDEQRTGEFVVLATPGDVAERLAAERVAPYGVGAEQIQVVDLRAS